MANTILALARLPLLNNSLLALQEAIRVQLYFVSPALAHGIRAPPGVGIAHGVCDGAEFQSVGPGFLVVDFCRAGISLERQQVGLQEMSSSFVGVEDVEAVMACNQRFEVGL